jgi:hypothetical protein
VRTLRRAPTHSDQGIYGERPTRIDPA